MGGRREEGLEAALQEAQADLAAAQEATAAAQVAQTQAEMPARPARPLALGVWLICPVMIPGSFPTFLQQSHDWLMAACIDL